MIPRITIDFEQPNDNDFVIEELTFNPYISKVNRFGGLEADIWIEFSIKKISDKAISIPKIILKFSGDKNLLRPPTTSIPEKISGKLSTGDLNFIMYSDIWYSFVRLNDCDYEFMRYGYKCPIRVLQQTSPAETLTESAITGGYDVFRRGKLKVDTDSLRRRVNYFNSVSTGPTPLNWKKGNDNYDKKLEVCIPVDEKAFSSVNFQFNSTPLKGRFAVRRIPWIENMESSFGIGYGGTADIETISNQNYKLCPKMFDTKTSEKIEAFLDKDELLRFWVMFSSDNCMSGSINKIDRIGFSYQIEINSKLESFNSFLRIPVGYEAVPGTISDYKHYAVPPRLFFLWDNYLPEQCLSLTQVFTTTHPTIELSAAFKDLGAENEKLIRLFIFAFLASMLGNLLVSALFSESGSKDFLLKMNLKVVASVAIVVLTIATILVYHNHRIDILKILAVVVLFFVSFYVLTFGLIYFMICISLAIITMCLAIPNVSTIKFESILPVSLRRYSKKLQYISKRKI